MEEHFEAQPDKQLMRIIQEIVPGRQITLAHIIANPRPVIYQKLGLDPKGEYSNSAIGVLTMSPAELAIIGSDIATKSAEVDLGFVDRFSGTLIVTGTISNVEIMLKSILDYSLNTLNCAICPVTRT
ncbi:MAG: BMC domain-containing protein [Synergistaceae bacterium]|jgi:ethanolamine utilization protein EutS|nr:BMC domain-containing protein [Synergistaceae bacterium]